MRFAVRLGWLRAPGPAALAAPADPAAPRAVAASGRAGRRQASVATHGRRAVLMSLFSGLKVWTKKKHT